MRIVHESRELPGSQAVFPSTINRRKFHRNIWPICIAAHGNNDSRMIILQENQMLQMHSRESHISHL